MVVLDKRAGIAVHPAPGHAEHTLVHGLLARYPDLPGIGGTQRPGIVHRLDLDTSGLMMVAKTPRGMASLAAQLEARKVRKGYIALLKGRLEKTSGIIDAPIARDPIHRQRMAIVAGGRQARTRYQQLAGWNDATLVLAQPETGRTHQIRVHFTALGAPVAGDATYGGMVDYLDRQFLHAAFLRFGRPCDSETVEVDSPLPADLRGALGGILQSHGTPAIEIDRSIAQMLALAKRHYCKSS
jgi:23S rRNA pseudouridine1911/1915/1917 synthase